MIKELKDLKPTVDVLEPGKLKASRGGVRYTTNCGPVLNRNVTPSTLVCVPCTINE
jgi:hypothetical protein